MNGTVENGTHNDEKLSAKSRTRDDDVRAVRDLVSRYVDQLLHGCGNPSCTEVTCATGRRSTSRKPVRDYTPRSARAIALTLASAPNPRLRLCQESRSKPTLYPKKVVDGPRDPSALIQQLSDTASVQRVSPWNSGLSEPDHAIRLNSSAPFDASFVKGIRHWHSILDDCSHALEDSSSQLSFRSDLNGNVPVAADLCACLEWLAGTLPDATHNEWASVNAEIGRGSTYPDNCFDDDVCVKERKTELLDSLDYGPRLRLLCRLLEVIAARAAAESQIDDMLKQRGNGDAQPVPRTSLLFPVSRRVAQEDYRCVRTPILIWLKKVFLQHWNGESILEKGNIATTAIQLLDTIATFVFGNDDYNDGRPNELWTYFRAIPGRLDAAEVARSYLGAEGDDNVVHILDCNSVFMPHELAVYFRTISHLKMRKAHSAAEIAANIRARYEHAGLDDEPEGRLGWLEEHYLLLNVSRQSIVQDAFNQLWHRRKSELLRPLRIRLGETDEFEIGHDLGGVQIEFFNLLWRELLREETGMFTTDSSNALTYFRPGSLQPLYMFELCGLLFGIAVYNGITLPVDFPLAFYAHLLQRVRLWDLLICDRWPEETRSLQSIIREEFPGLEAVVPLEANGLRLSILANGGMAQDEDGSNIINTAHVVEASRIVHHQPHIGNGSETGHDESETAVDPLHVDIESIKEAWPGWRLRKAETPPVEVTPETKQWYAIFYSIWLTWGSVAPQFSAFEKGFRTIIDEHSTNFLTLEAFTAIVEGTKRLDIDALIHATDYENYDPNSRYIHNFWRLVTNWPEEKQRQLLKFVTAIERMPAGGARNFTFKIERQRPDEPDKLPTSSTCFRTLYLPKYPSVDVLDRKLTLAFEYGLEGFGTG